MKIIAFIITLTLLSFSACEETNSNEKTETIQSLTKKISKDKKNASYYEQRANLYRSSGNIHAAITDLKKATELAPDSMSYFLSLSEAYMNVGEVTNTLKTLEYITKKDVNNYQAWNKIGEIYLLYKKYKEAMKFANKSLEINPYNDKAYFLKAYIYKENADTNNAIDNFIHCLKHNPENNDANIEIALLFSGLKNDLAIEYFNNAIKIDSTNINAFYGLGLYYQNNDMLNEAISVYKEINEIDSLYSHSYFNIGFIYLELLNIPNKSIKYFAKAIEVNPEYIEAYFNLGLAFETLGDIKSAEKFYLKALQIDPYFKNAAKGLQRVRN